MQIEKWNLGLQVFFTSFCFLGVSAMLNPEESIVINRPSLAEVQRRRLFNQAVLKELRMWEFEGDLLIEETLSEFHKEVAFNELKLTKTITLLSIEPLSYPLAFLLAKRRAYTVKKQLYLGRLKRSLLQIKASKELKIQREVVATSTTRFAGLRKVFAEFSESKSRLKRHSMELDAVWEVIYRYEPFISTFFSFIKEIKNTKLKVEALSEVVRVIGRKLDRCKAMRVGKKSLSSKESSEIIECSKSIIELRHQDEREKREFEQFEKRVSQQWGILSRRFHQNVEEMVRLIVKINVLKKRLENLFANPLFLTCKDFISETNEVKLKAMGRQAIQLNIELLNANKVICEKSDETEAMYSKAKNSINPKELTVIELISKLSELETLMFNKFKAIEEEDKISTNLLEEQLRRLTGEMKAKTQLGKNCYGLIMELRVREKEMVQAKANGFNTFFTYFEIVMKFKESIVMFNSDLYVRETKLTALKLTINAAVRKIWTTLMNVCPTFCTVDEFNIIINKAKDYFKEPSAMLLTTFNFDKERGISRLPFTDDYSELRKFWEKNVDAKSPLTAEICSELKSFVINPFFDLEIRCDMNEMYEVFCFGRYEEAKGESNIDVVMKARKFIHYVYNRGFLAHGIAPEEKRMMNEINPHLPIVSPCENLAIGLFNAFNAPQRKICFPVLEQDGSISVVIANSVYKLVKHKEDIENSGVYLENRKLIYIKGKFVLECGELTDNLIDRKATYKKMQKEIKRLTTLHGPWSQSDCAELEEFVIGRERELRFVPGFDEMEEMLIEQCPQSGCAERDRQLEIEIMDVVQAIEKRAKAEKSVLTSRDARLMSSNLMNKVITKRLERKYAAQIQTIFREFYIINLREFQQGHEHWKYEEY